MPSKTNDFINILRRRGFIHQMTDEASLGDVPSLIGYIGFDATADSLHVGSLLPIMLLYWLQQTGHQPIVLMGGGTTRIGDPSGKDAARQALDDAAIARNIAGIQRIFDRYLTFGEGRAMMVNNAEWLGSLNYLDFLRDYGRHFTINRMLTFDSVKLRLEREQPLTFLEFNYMILQAYDFMELHQRYGCRLQMGGSDQWGNIINGVELTRRVLGKEVFGLTSPLLTTASGAKMGKTADGAVWLNAERLPVYDFWQFWRNTDDADVGRFLKLFTTLPLDEINRLASLQGAEINEAKHILATEVTRLCHGRDAAEAAAATAAQTFNGDGLGATLPTFTVDLARGVSVIDALKLAGFATSNGEARRLIIGGGVRINDTPCSSPDATLTTADAAQGVVRLSSGKKKHVVLKA